MVISRTNQGLVQTSDEELSGLAKQAGVVEPVTPSGSQSIGATPDQAKMAGTPVQKTAALAQNIDRTKDLATAQRLQTQPTTTDIDKASVDTANRLRQFGSITTRLDSIIAKYKSSQLTPEEQTLASQAITDSTKLTAGQLASGGVVDPQVATDLLGPGWESLSVEQLQQQIQTLIQQTESRTAEVKRLLADPATSNADRQGLQQELARLSGTGVTGVEAEAAKVGQEITEMQPGETKTAWASTVASGDADLEAAINAADNEILTKLTGMSAEDIKKAYEAADSITEVGADLLGIDSSVKFVLDPTQQEQLAKLQPEIRAISDLGIDYLLKDPVIGSNLKSDLADGSLTAKDLRDHARYLTDSTKFYQDFQELSDNIVSWRKTKDPDSLESLVSTVFGYEGDTSHGFVASINTSINKLREYLNYNPGDKAQRQTYESLKSLVGADGVLDTRDIDRLAMEVEKKKPTLEAAIKGNLRGSVGQTRPASLLQSILGVTSHPPGDDIAKVVKAALADKVITKEEVAANSALLKRILDPAWQDLWVKRHGVRLDPEVQSQAAWSKYYKGKSEAEQKNVQDKEANLTAIFDVSGGEADYKDYLSGFTGSVKSMQELGIGTESYRQNLARVITELKNSKWSNDPDIKDKIAWYEDKYDTIAARLEREAEANQLKDMIDNTKTYWKMTGKHTDKQLSDVQAWTDEYNHLMEATE